VKEKERIGKEKRNARGEKGEVERKDLTLA